MLRRGKRRKSIRNNLLIRVLPLVLVPPVVLGLIVLLNMNALVEKSTANLDGESVLSDEAIGSDLQRRADAASEAWDAELTERIADLRALATNPLVIEAAVVVNATAAAQPVPGESITGSETGRGIAPTIVRYFGEQAEPFFNEVTLSDRVGKSTGTGSVAQDALWWQSAWTDGSYIGMTLANDELGQPTIDMAIRVDFDGSPVGVVRGVLSPESLARFADQTTAANQDLTVEVVGASGPSVEGQVAAAVQLISIGPDDNSQLDESSRNNILTVSGESGSVGASDHHVGFARSKLVALTVLVTTPRSAAGASARDLATFRSNIENSRSLLLTSLASIMGIALLVSVAGTLLLSRQIVGPVVKLRQAADEAATKTMPGLLEQLRTQSPDDPLPLLAPIEIHTGDEVEALAESFSTMQYAAARLAVDQMRLRQQSTSQIFISLGRRNQNLINRQIERIDQFEQEESNPDTLDQLFQLDHLATRIRRNAENLLVLAGEQAPRRWDHPVSAREVIKAAISEVEHYHRVTLSDVEEAEINGDTASDTSHLLAELIENAIAFSPPETVVKLAGFVHEDGYTIGVFDEGIGMDEGHRAEANSRFTNPASFDDVPTNSLGHFVIGHLAVRHDIRVELVPGLNAGTVARVELPLHHLSSNVDTPRLPTEFAEAYDLSNSDDSLVSADPIFEDTSDYPTEFERTSRTTQTSPSEDSPRYEPEDLPEPLGGLPAPLDELPMPAEAKDDQAQHDSFLPPAVERDARADDEILAPTATRSDPSTFSDVDTDMTADSDSIGLESDARTVGLDSDTVPVPRASLPKLFARVSTTSTTDAWRPQPPPPPPPPPPQSQPQPQPLRSPSIVDDSNADDDNSNGDYGNEFNDPYDGSPIDDDGDVWEAELVHEPSDAALDLTRHDDDQNRGDGSDEFVYNAADEYERDAEPDHDVLERLPHGSFDSERAARIQADLSGLFDGERAARAHAASDDHNDEPNSPTPPHAPPGHPLHQSSRHRKAPAKRNLPIEELDIVSTLSTGESMTRSGFIRRQPGTHSPLVEASTPAPMPLLDDERRNRYRSRQPGGLPRPPASNTDASESDQPQEKT